jgi:hypothetical protein
MAKANGSYRLISIVGLILAVSILVVAAAQATAQVRTTRQVNYDFVIDPPVISLARIEELRPEGAVFGVWMIVIPDKTIPPSPEGEQIVAALTGLAEDMSRTYDSKEDYEVRFGSPAGPLSQLIDFSGAKLKLSAMFRNDPAFMSRLGDDSYFQLDSKSFDLDGQTFVLARWGKRKDNRKAVLGTATAILNLEAKPGIGSVSSLFTGNFTKTDGSEISADGLPTDPEARKLARERYDVFRKKVDDEYNEILKVLNKPQPMLSEAERLELGNRPEGAEFSFNRTIAFDWFGEKKEVGIVMTAKLGPLRLLSDTDEPEIRPFEDD